MTRWNYFYTTAMPSIRQDLFYEPVAHPSASGPPGGAHPAGQGGPGRGPRGGAPAGRPAAFDPPAPKPPTTPPSSPITSGGGAARWSTRADPGPLLRRKPWGPKAPWMRRRASSVVPGHRSGAAGRAPRQGFSGQPPGAKTVLPARRAPRGQAGRPQGQRSAAGAASRVSLPPPGGAARPCRRPGLPADPAPQFPHRAAAQAGKPAGPFSPAGKRSLVVGRGRLRKPGTVGSLPGRASGLPVPPGCLRASRPFGGQWRTWRKPPVKWATPGCAGQFGSALTLTAPRRFPPCPLFYRFPALDIFLAAVGISS